MKIRKMMTMQVSAQNLYLNSSLKIMELNMRCIVSIMILCCLLPTSQKLFISIRQQQTKMDQKWLLFHSAIWLECHSSWFLLRIMNLVKLLLRLSILLTSGIRLQVTIKIPFFRRLWKRSILVDLAFIHHMHLLFCLTWLDVKMIFWKHQTGVYQISRTIRLSL